MRSWIFRHRLRLRAIYGPRPEPAEAPVGPRGTRSRTPRAPAPKLHGLAPGESAFVGESFVLRPMPKPAA